MDAHAHSNDAGTPQAHDPVHDIDAKKTMVWLVAWVALLGLSLYFLLVVFGHVLQAERVRRIEQVKDPALANLIEAQQKILAGEGSEGRKGMTIEQAMEAMTAK